MAATTQQVHAAISALYGSNPAQQKEANDFLVAFASTAAAWEVSLQLVGTAGGGGGGGRGVTPEPSRRGPFVSLSSRSLALVSRHRRLQR